MGRALGSTELKYLVWENGGSVSWLLFDCERIVEADVSDGLEKSGKAYMWNSLLHRRIVGHRERFVRSAFSNCHILCFKIFLLIVLVLLAGEGSTRRKGFGVGVCGVLGCLLVLCWLLM